MLKNGFAYGVVKSSKNNAIKHCKLFQNQYYFIFIHKTKEKGSEKKDKCRLKMGKRLMR